MGLNSEGVGTPAAYNTERPSTIESASERKRLFVISDSLPLSEQRASDDTVSIEPETGGLVVVLEPVARNFANENTDVLWIGTTTEPHLQVALDEYSTDPKKGSDPTAKIHYGAVLIPQDVFSLYFFGVANGLLYGASHAGHTGENPTAEELETFDLDQQSHYPEYIRVNEIIVQELERRANGFISDDEFMFNDYHTIPAARALRDKAHRQGVNPLIGWQNHVPFFKENVFTLFEREIQVDLLTAFSYFDLVSMQRESDVKNFLNCIQANLPYLPEAQVIANSQGTFFEYEGRLTKIASNLVGVDPKTLKAQENVPGLDEARERFAKEYAQRLPLLTLARDDPSKNITRTILAYGRTVEKYPDLRKANPVFFVGAHPVLLELAPYRKARKSRADAVVQVNSQGRKSDPLMVCYNQGIHGAEKQMLMELVDNKLIGSRADGCNITPIEFLIVGSDHQAIGVTRTSGIIDKFPSLYQIENPLDEEVLADGIYYVMTMPQFERKWRTAQGRRELSSYNTLTFTDNFFADLRSMRSRE